MHMISAPFKTLASFLGIGSRENSCVVEVPSSNTRKRQQNENILETIAKRRRTNLRSYLENDVSIDSVLRTRSLEKSINQKRIQKNENIKNPVAVIDIRELKVVIPNIQTVYRSYGINEELQKQGQLLLKKEVTSLKETKSCEELRGNREVENRLSSFLTSPPAVCTRSRLCLHRVHKEQEAAALLQMVKKYSRSSAHTRKSLPLTMSTRHNANQSKCMDYDSSDRTNRLSRMAVPPLKNLSPVEQIDLTIESQTEEAVMDLTADDDDDDNVRQENVTEANEMSLLPETRNLGKLKIRESFVVRPEYHVDLTKSCKQKGQKTELQVSLRKIITDSCEGISESLANVLERRLCIKRNVSELAVDHRPAWEMVLITPSMKTEIEALERSKRVPLVKIQNEPVQLHDVRTLNGTNWLNDVVINSYMKLIQLRAENDPNMYPKVHCFNTFLYPALKSRGYSSVRRWTKKVDIFLYQIIIIPIHLGRHWCLVEVLVDEQRILYYDSMGSSGNKACLETIMQYLVNEYFDKKGEQLDEKKWTLKNVRGDEIPKQTNAHDCGVFACTYAEHITRRAPFNFDELHMPYFRLKMKYEILTGNLLL